MKLDRDFLTSCTGQMMLVGAVLLVGILAVRWQNQRRPAPPLPVAKPAPSPALPKTLTREGVRLTRPPAPPVNPALPPAAIAPVSEAKVELPRELPLTIFTAPQESSPPLPALSAPYGRLVPCETVIALESNRLETPVIGLVTEDVWHAGKLLIPAGAEVHGRASIDRARERLAAQGEWRIVWRTPDRDNGAELAVQGLALDREVDSDSRLWGEHDGSAGLRGQIVKTDNDRELTLFAATFLATATAALQETRPTAGLLGESSAPTATARNAVLAGTGAVLREHAQAMREAIARDGFYLRVPAGKPFYLYLTQTLDRSQARRGPVVAHAAAPSHP
jgi:type F conjugative transfer system protein TrbI